jgi:2-oxoglutarate dehydrogenase E1 component
MATSSDWQSFFGPNAGYALELYERYQQDPSAVDGETRAFFEQHDPPTFDDGAAGSANDQQVATAVVAAAPQSALPPGVVVQPGRQPFIADTDVARIVGAARLARSIREYGHLQARIDPLGKKGPGDPMLDASTHGLTDDDLAALPASIVWRMAGPELGSCLDAIRRLHALYSGSIGYDFDHVQDYEERAWLVEQVEQGAFTGEPAAEERRTTLERLVAVEEFERFLHSTFQGQKRFSIEGNDVLVPMLDALIGAAADVGTREVLIGMAHRGRLNVLAHVLGKPYAAIFSEFHHAPNKELVPSEGSRGINEGWSGDVKYHLGARRTVQGGEEDVSVQLTLAHNPSHLEFVNPVVIGSTRAAQEKRHARGVPQLDVDCALAVTIHGDAAFPGEGVVAETLNLSRLPGYQVGGTIHIIVNNQIGFTTGARDARSTLYASDLAKGFEIPIIHVNGDDAEACLAAIRLAHAYRQKFHKDFLIDLVGYRRWGHNEGDDPTYTQPLLYATITKHPTVRTSYAARLQELGVIAEGELETMVAAVRERLQGARSEAEEGHVKPEGAALTDSPRTSSYHTAIPESFLRTVNAELLARPDGYSPNEKLEKILHRREAALDKRGGIDWGHAETLAFASILADGTPIRLTGQDSERGTFVQRHSILNDTATGKKYSPLGALAEAEASFAVYNSPLSEAAPIGFEYGYSIHAPETLVLWEAQFGDFANAGQVLIDQFIAAARAKWRQEPSLVLLLPHGYEGQGPEHSSARLERFLQLAAQDNLRVANPTTAAQYFHLLRVQAATLEGARRPLVVMTPKSLLRHPRAGSSLTDLTEGTWQPVLDDPMDATKRGAVRRLLLCSGKVAVDLVGHPTREGAESVAIARLEQLYPFPAEEVAATIAAYPNLDEVVWLQEEPRNMGAWSYVAPRLEQALRESRLPLHYVGRPTQASTAEGSADVHAAEQARIVEEGLGGSAAARVEEREKEYVR